MGLSVKKGKIPQLMLDGKRVLEARFLSKRAGHDGKTRYVFAIPEHVEIERKKRSHKKKEVTDEDTGDSSEGEVVNKPE